MKVRKWLCVFGSIFILAACSGGSDSSIGVSGNNQGLTHGVAVDPYIVDAVFQEVGADGVTILQRQSTASSAFGVFTFPNGLTGGSTVEMKVANKGTHAGASFNGMLRRKIAASDAVSINVTPLTTILATGVLPEDLLQALINAGFSGLSTNDLYGDPMNGLVALTGGVTDAKLELLQANMAAEAYMETTGNFAPGLGDLINSNQAQILNSMAGATRSRLSAAEFNRVSTALASDPQMSGPLTLGDLILAVTQQQQTMIAAVKAGPFDPALVTQAVTNGKNEVVSMAKNQAMGRQTPTSSTAATLYADNCAACHRALANSSKTGRTAAQIQSAIDANRGGMGSQSLRALTTAEVQAIADALSGTTTPPTNPGTTPDGPTLYANNCAGCHGALASTSKPGRTAAQIQAAINGNVGGMGGLSALITAEVQAIATALPAAPPTNPGGGTPDGAALYSSACSGCHGALASTTKPGRTAVQIQAAITANSGGMGGLSALTTAEIQAIADVLPPSTGGGGPDYSDCTACHGQPPAGSSYPNVAGAHGVHTVLASVNNNCATCHIGAAHNDVVNLGISTAFNAKSGTAIANGNNTCSSVRCHGGQTTPVWQTGAINVATQCASCHASGSTQYNGYSSGRHSLHINRGYSCTVCHNTSKLATGHFSNLATSGFEQDPAATIGGGTTRISSYSPSANNPTSGSCNPNCHGSENW